MQWVYNLSLSKKLQFSFLLVAVLTAIVGYIGYVGMTGITENLNVTYNEKLVPITYLGDANAGLLSVRGEVRNLMITKDEKMKAKYVENIENDVKRTTSNMESYSKLVKNDDEKLLLKSFNDNFEKYSKLRDEIIRLVLDNKTDEAFILADGDARS
nr:MCP four helix bundle domain-containing protein [Melioribacteraceae bacterium]